MSDSTDAAAIREQIAKIDKRLATGIRQVTTDGTTTTIDPRVLKEERARLERKLMSITQPIAATVNMSHG